MEQASADISIERGGVSSPRRAVTPDAVVEAVLSLRGDRDATLEVASEGRDGRLLIAVDGPDAFVGLLEEGGVSELSDPQRAGRPARRFLIGGQATTIGSEFCLPLEDAARVAEAWLAGAERLPVGRWVRR